MVLAREGHDNARLAVAHRALAFSLFVAGELSETDALYTECVRLADNVPDAAFSAYGEHPGMLGRGYGGLTRCFIGFLEQAAQLGDANVEHARARHSPHNLAWALAASGLIRIHFRDTVGAERYCRESIEVAREHRLRQWLATAQATLGKALCLRGEPQAGIGLQEEGIRSLHAAGSVLNTTRYRIWLAESFLGLGELQRARVEVEAGHAHRETYGEGYFAAELERVEAELLRAEGAPSQAVGAQLNKAISTAHSQGARLLELRAATSLARLWRNEGRGAEAHALLAPIYGWFSEGFGMPDLQEAKALLDELAEPS
jgi:hypothetical protein